MLLADRRKSMRYAVAEDRANCLAIIDRKEYQVVLSDTSACGFGMMLLGGVSISPDQRLRLITSDGIHDCRIAYARKDQSIQHVGLERLADVSLVEMPKRKGGKRFFKDGMNGASPFVFLAIILGCTSAAAMFVLGMDVSAAAEEGKIIVIDQTPQPKPEDIESLRDKSKSAAKTTVKVISNYFDELSIEERVAFNAVATRANITWDDMVRRLKLTRKQQRSILQTIKEQAGIQSVDERFSEMKSGIRGTLEDEQLNRFDRMFVSRKKPAE